MSSPIGGERQARDPIQLHTVLIEEFNHQYPERPIDAATVEAERAKWEAHFSGVPKPYDRARSAESRLIGEVGGKRLAIQQVYRRIRETGCERAALCLSGGGIRSAIFGLGVVEALARRGLLRSFDYLSTVSGGGHLGSWLSAWIARQAGGVAAVEAELADAAATLYPETSPVHNLRLRCRESSARFGMVSRDTWTVVAAFIRNLLINWLVLVPLLAAVLLLPRIAVALAGLYPPDSAVQAVFWGGVVAGMVAIAFIIANRPSLTSTAKGRAVSRWPAALQGHGAFLWLCLLPLAAMAVAVTLAWYWTVRDSPLYSVHFVLFERFRLSAGLAFVLFGVVLHLGGFLLSRLWVHTMPILELFGVLDCGAMGGLLTWGAAWAVSTRLALDTALGREVYICGAAPLLLALLLLAVTLFVALASKWTSDEDRKWVARGAWRVLMLAMASNLVSVLVIFGPLLWYFYYPGLGAVVGGLPGLVAALGLVSKSKAENKRRGEPASRAARVIEATLALSVPLFVMSIVVWLSALTSLGLRFLVEWRFGGPLPLASGLLPHGFLNVIAQTPVYPVVGLGAALVALGLVAGYFVDSNRYSLLGGYRDRLIEVYLGASRQAGAERPLEGQADLELVALARNRPLHVLNGAINLVRVTDLTWEDRKAESFTFSALHCGYRGGYRSSQSYGRRKDGTRISLGTAAAISGAAASPTMDSHPSPLLAFLRDLFNLRLGWWLGNPGPAGAATFDTQGPREALAVFAADMLGLTNEGNPYVYLSDGGHFENLGLYEMVLRRCRFIVVIDGSQDSKYQFADLGNAIARIRIDMGVPIDFFSLPMRERRRLRAKSYDPRKKARFPSYALARIRYSVVDGPPEIGDRADSVDGWLLYLKPSLNGREPADVFHYAKLHADFPHESIGNSFAGEAQFESYRALGTHIVDSLPEATVPGDLGALFAVLCGQQGGSDQGGGAPAGVTKTKAARAARRRPVGGATPA